MITAVIVEHASALLAQAYGLWVEHVPLAQLHDETTFGAVLAAAVCVVAVALSSLFGASKSTPPSLGLLWPLICGKLNLVEEGASGFVSYGYKTVGDIFRFRVLHRNVTMLVGSDANTVFFEAKDDVLSQREVYGFTVPVFGKDVVYDAPLSVMTQQLRFVKHGLSTLAMATHSTKIAKEAEDYIADWGDSGDIDIYHALSELTIKTASRCLLGKEIRERVQDRFATLYQVRVRSFVACRLFSVFCLLSVACWLHR
jgi:sterol 14-demethylase